MRAIKAAILLALTEKDSGGTLTDDQELKLLSKMAKQRKDSAEIYSKENRTDLAEKELFELSIIQNYLPAQIEGEELRAIIQSIIEESGANSMKDMGRVMGIASGKLAGKADGKSISGIVRELSE